MKETKRLTEEKLLRALDPDRAIHYSIFTKRKAYEQLREIVGEHFRMKTMQETEHLIKDPYPIQPKKPTVSDAGMIEKYTINIKEIIKYVDKNYDASDYMETPPESYDIAGLILGFLRKIGLTVSGLTVSNE